MCDFSGCVELDVFLIITGYSKHESDFISGPLCQNMKQHQLYLNTSKEKLSYIINFTDLHFSKPINQNKNLLKA